MNDPGRDLDLRLVRYFTVVAKHQNFARAAAELHLAQPSLSRQIQRLERYLGVRLLDRTSRGSRTTPEGEAFLAEARELLRAARRAERIVRENAGAERIAIGYVEDLVITPAVRELRRRHPDAEVSTHHLTCRDIGALHDGRVDVLVARDPLPLPADGVDTILLYEEPRMLVVPVGHPLAGRTSVAVGELADQEPAPCAIETAGWTSHRLLGAGSAAVGNFEDKLELVAGGRAIAVVPVGDRRSSLRPDLVTVPIDGAPTSRVVLVGRRGDPNPMVEWCRAVARATLNGGSS